MGAYAIWRALLIVPTLLLLTVLVLILVRFMPGNVVDMIIHDMMNMQTGAGGK